MNRTGHTDTAKQERNESNQVKIPVEIIKDPTQGSLPTFHRLDSELISITQRVQPFTDGLHIGAGKKFEIGAIDHAATSDQQPG